MKKILLIIVMLALVLAAAVATFILNRCPDSPAAAYLRARRSELFAFAAEKRVVVEGWWSSFFAGKGASDSGQEVVVDDIAEAPGTSAAGKPSCAAADGSAVIEDDAKETRSEPYPWRFTKENWYGGRGLVTKDVKDKVVMVYLWNCENEASVALLPRIQKTWAAYRHKPIMVIGSHRGGGRSKAAAQIVKSRKLSFPNFEGAGFRCEPKGISRYPYIYVVDAKGKIVYRGGDDMAATDAMISAIDFGAAR